MNTQNQDRIKELESNPNRTPEDNTELERLKKIQDQPESRVDAEHQSGVSRPQGDVTKGTAK